MGSKPNPMLAKIEAKYAAEYEAKLAIAQANFRRMLDMTLQHSSDAALMAIDDVFDVSVESAEKFHIAHVEYVNEIAKLTVDDSEADPEIWYTKEVLDRRLRQIVGEDNFVPWDERYTRERNKAAKGGLWIPVTKLLPEEYVPVLVLTDDEGIGIAVYNRGRNPGECRWAWEWEDEDNDGTIRSDDGTTSGAVTHWLPLPHPPKGE